MDSDNSSTIVTVTTTEPLDWSPLPEHDTRLPCPIDVLPEPVGSYVQGLSDALQVPPDLVLSLALVVLSGSTRGRWRVEGPSAQWMEPLSIYSAVLLPPGELKSPTLKAVAIPLRAFEAELQVSKRLLVAQNRERLEMFKERVRGLRSKVAAKPGDESLAAEYDDAMGKLTAFQAVAMPQLLVQDVTPERLASLLAEQDESLTLLSAEGGIIGTLAGRYSDGRANLDLVNAAYSAEFVRVDRQGRESLHLNAPHLAIGLATQPDVFQEVLSNRQMVGRGFLDRFLIAVPKSRVGSRKLGIEAMPANATSAWEMAVRNLLTASFELTAEDEFRTLTLSAPAKRAYTPWWSAVETQMAVDGELAELSGWFQKARGGALRLAGLLTLAANPNAASIGEGEMQAAIDVVDYLASHARYIRMEAIPGSTGKVLAAVRNFPEEEFTTRLIHRKVQNQTWCHTSADVEQELHRLTRLGYVRRMDAEKGTKSHDWQRHPDLGRSLR
ncbi:MAG: YfjI family protein [Actinomycetota bacterium]|nr:YfjI family protein [Actinomycetota bacterium]